MAKFTRMCVCLASIGCLVWGWPSRQAWAQEKAAVKKEKKEAKPRTDQPFELGPIIVTARPTRPSAVVELGKLLPEVKMSSIRQPFVAKIESAILREPF